MPAKYPNTPACVLDRLRQDETPESVIKSRDSQQFTILRKKEGDEGWTEAERDIVCQALQTTVFFNVTQHPIVISGHFSSRWLAPLQAAIRAKFTTQRITGFYNIRLPFMPNVQHGAYSATTMA